jgi:hypothetical protein
MTLHNNGLYTVPSLIDCCNRERLTNGNTLLTFKKKRSTKWVMISSGGRSSLFDICCCNLNLSNFFLFVNTLNINTYIALLPWGGGLSWDEWGELTEMGGGTCPPAFTNLFSSSTTRSSNNLTYPLCGPRFLYSVYWHCILASKQWTHSGFWPSHLICVY